MAIHLHWLLVMEDTRPRRLSEIVVSRVDGGVCCEWKDPSCSCGSFPTVSDSVGVSVEMEVIGAIGSQSSFRLPDETLTTSSELSAPQWENELRLYSVAFGNKKLFNVIILL
jgi:hypothetical protein